jgi:uncharacterized protein YlxW (UPF0749 family)
LRTRRNRYALVVGLLTAMLAFVAVVQVRSQAEVVRSLEGQDSTALAFLIDDLHRANDSLASDAAVLGARRDALRGGSNQEADAQLNAEASQLRVIEGLVPVHGPGVVITIDAPLTPLDLQDAVNTLRVAGAEAVSLNDHRIVTGTVIKLSGDAINVDGSAARGPWSLSAIGEPTRLAGAADQMTRALRDDPRVRRADYRSENDLAIRSTVVQRPFVYGSA